MSEGLQKVKATELSDLRATCLIAALATGVGGLVTPDAGFFAAGSPQKLSGAQIRAKLSGKEITDQIHWREVYERDGTFRSYSMGTKKTGKWSVQADDLCIDLPEPEGGCFEVSASGTYVVLTPKGLGLPVDGLLQAPSDPK